MNLLSPSDPIVLSTAYLPPIQYFTKLLHREGVLLETAENFVKQSYRNRCHIAGPEGMQPLTIPVEKSPSRQPSARRRAFPQNRRILLLGGTAWPNQIGRAHV